MPGQFGALQDSFAESQKPAAAEQDKLSGRTAAVEDRLVRIEQSAESLGQAIYEHGEHYRQLDDR